MPWLDMARRREQLAGPMWEAAAVAARVALGRARGTIGDEVSNKRAMETDDGAMLAGMQESLAVGW